MSTTTLHFTKWLTLGVLANSSYLRGHRCPNLIYSCHAPDLTHRAHSLPLHTGTHTHTHTHTHARAHAHMHIRALNSPCILLPEGSLSLSCCCCATRFCSLISFSLLCCSCTWSASSAFILLRGSFSSDDDLRVYSGPSPGV